MEDKPIMTSGALIILMWSIIAFSSYMWLKAPAVCTASEQTCNYYMH